MKRPASPALSFSQLNTDFFPREKWISFLCWLGFPASWHSHHWLSGSFNEKSKDQMLQAGLESTQPASSLSEPSLRGILCSNSKFGDFPLCVMSPRHTSLRYNTTATPKSQNLRFWPVSCGFYDNSRGLIISISKLCFHFNLVRFNGYTAIRCPDLVSKCGPSSGFHSSLGSYFLYRDVITATKTDLQSHSIQTAGSATRLVRWPFLKSPFVTATSWWCWFETLILAINEYCDPSKSSIPTKPAWDTDCICFIHCVFSNVL